MDDVRRSNWPPGVVRWGELDGIRGFDALRLLNDGLLARLRGGPFSDGDDSVPDGLAVVREIVGTVSLLPTRRPGMTLFLIPSPVNVSPLSGNRMGCCTALPVFSSENSCSISLRSELKLDSQMGMTSSGSGGGSG